MESEHHALWNQPATSANRLVTLLSVSSPLTRQGRDLVRTLGS